MNKSLEIQVIKASQDSIASKPLGEIVKKGDKVTFLTDNITRLTPTIEILLHILDESNRGGMVKSNTVGVINNSAETIPIKEYLQNA